MTTPPSVQVTGTPVEGDPVVVATGEEIQTYDLIHLPGPMPVEIDLYYMSKSDAVTDLASRFFLNVPLLFRQGATQSETSSASAAAPNAPAADTSERRNKRERKGKSSSEKFKEAFTKKNLPALEKFSR